LLFFERKVANLIYAYPDGPQDMDKATIISVSDMITDAVGETEYLIEIDQQRTIAARPGEMES